MNQIDQLSKLYKELNINPVFQKEFKKLNQSQKFRVFEKEVLSFFIRDVPNFEHMFKLNAFIYRLDRTTNKFEVCSNYADLMIQMKAGGSLIFKVTLISVAGIDRDVIREALDKYMACDKKFFSYVFDEVFDIGDGDDSGAVTYKSIQNYLTADIWVRSL